MTTDSRARYLLSAVVDVRAGETRTVALMFACAFFSMTAYNIVQPVTRSVFISDLGADNVPYVLLVAGVLIGLVIQLYVRLLSLLPERWALPIMQLAMSVVLLAFFVGFWTGGAWVSSGFYLFGQILGTLLLSQFWTLANEVYDPRQARRLFGFIGGGASLGGMTGSGFAALVAGPIGTDALLLVSAGALVVSSVVVALVLAGRPRVADASAPLRESEASLGEAWTLVRESPNLRQLALLTSFSAVGAMVIDQQLNLAAEAFRGGNEDAVTSFLASVRFLLSGVALVMQIVLVKQIYRLLGVGFALLLLPISLGASSLLIILTGVLWAPALASIVDRSVRYTVDRTTREIFFLPLSSDVKHKAKTFIDVTADRVARGLGAVVVLVAIKPWGLAVDWPRLSILTLCLSLAWLWLAARARDQYVGSIRQSLEAEGVKAHDMRVGVADLTTVEALLEELAHPDERRVLYAIDVLESLDKRNLVTPLLLYHTAAAVRTRALGVIAESRAALPAPWRPGIVRLIEDPDPNVRAGAILALAKVQNQDATQLARALVADAENTPGLAASAAVVLANSREPGDITMATQTLTRLATDLRDTSADARRDAASAIGKIDTPHIRQLLIPLLQDPVPAVAETAMHSVRTMHPPDILFIPTLVSLLGDRRLKSGARDALVDHGEPVLELLGHVLADPSEDAWIRRHVPATIARIPCQAAMDLLVHTLDDTDQMLRYKALAAMTVLRRRDPSLAYPTPPVESLLHAETRSYFDSLVLGHDVFTRGGVPRTTVLHQVLDEHMARSVRRSYRLLALLHPWKDIANARWAIARGTPASRAQAFEYLDNVLAPKVRQTVLPMLEDIPIEQKVQRGHLIRRTHPVALEDALLALLNHPEEVVAAAAIDLVRSQQLWTLNDDVEHVLAHRDPRDWLVFEAASWTLASSRLTPLERQARWLEPLPAVVLADRLRGLPIFGSLTVDELCRVVSRGHQTRHSDQTLLLSEGVVPEAFHVVLDGRVTSSGRTSQRREIEGPALLGFEEALTGRPAPATVRAAGLVITAVVTRDALLTVLTGNTELVAGLFRTLAESHGATHAPTVLARAGRGQLPDTYSGNLTVIEKMLALQQVPIFAGLESVELTKLAALAIEVKMDAGTSVAIASEIPALRLVLAGSISFRDPETDMEVGRAQAGDTVGLFESLAAQERLGHRLVAAERGSLLQLEGEDLFDLLGHRPTLLQHLFSALFDPPTRT